VIFSSLFLADERASPFLARRIFNEDGLIFTSDFLGRFLILILSLAGGLFRDNLNVLVPVLSKLVKSAHGRRPVQAV
jgi:hypothetical protein